MNDIRGRTAEFARGLRVRTTDEEPHPTGWQWFADVLLGIAVAFALLNSRPHHDNWNPHLFYGNDHYIGGGVFDLLRALLATLPLALRRRYPLAAMWVIVFARITLFASS